MKRLIAATSGMAALALASAWATPPSGGGGGGGGDDGVYARGPAPTRAALQADRGPYDVSNRSVSSFVSGFNGGTIWYPTNAGTGMGAIVVIPPYLSGESVIRFYGPKLASWGFVVITIAPESIYDFPDARANQASAALDYVVAQSGSSSSVISGLVDPDRLGAVGWSMGGGASLKLASDRDLKGVFVQAPWYGGSNDFDEITEPVLLFGMENDDVAPVGVHADAFYDDLPSSTSKLYIEFNNASHFFVDEQTFGEIGVSWMKAAIDNDDRFEPFTCATNYSARFDISEQRNGCQF